MTRYGMVVDLSRCTACYGCFTSCKDEFWENDYPPYSVGQPRFGQFWINVQKKERGEYPYIKVGYMPLLCQQCADAPCMKAAKGGAIYRTEEGVVIIDPEKAVGQKEIVGSCPYGAIYWNEEKKLPQKCTLCIHRVQGGKKPRCVQFCPSGCLTFGDFDDPKSEVSKLLAAGKAEVFHPEWGTQPGVYYADLKEATGIFVAGSVIYGDVDACAEGATVVLKGPGGKQMRTKANAFGDFEFDGLMPGAYVATMRAPGYKGRALNFEVKTSEYLGVFSLVRNGQART